MGFLIKQKHQQIMEKKINDQLRLDVGDTVIIHEPGTKVGCSWCRLDTVNQTGSGIPANGKDWTTHSNYKGVTGLCPNCANLHWIQDDVTTSITCIVEDKDELEVVDGKFGRVNRGRKRITGKITDINGVTDFNENKLYKSVKVVIGGKDYRVKSVEALKLLNVFAFVAELDLFDRVDLPGSGVLTS